MSVPRTEEPGQRRLGMMGWAKSCRTTRAILNETGQAEGGNYSSLRLATVGALARLGRGYYGLFSCFCGSDKTSNTTKR